ncbi:hypothetical protein AB0J89_19715 [Micromonospora chokoriensis]
MSESLQRSLLTTPLQPDPLQVAAMSGLAVNVYATAILAQVEQDTRDAEQGVRTLRWS